MNLSHSKHEIYGPFFFFFWDFVLAFVPLFDKPELKAEVGVDRNQY